MARLLAAVVAAVSLASCGLIPADEPGPLGHLRAALSPSLLPPVCRLAVSGSSPPPVDRAVQTAVESWLGEIHDGLRRLWSDVEIDRFASLPRAETGGAGHFDHLLTWDLQVEHEPEMPYLERGGIVVRMILNGWLRRAGADADEARARLSQVLVISPSGRIFKLGGPTLDLTVLSDAARSSVADADEKPVCG